MSKKEAEDKEGLLGDDLDDDEFLALSYQMWKDFLDDMDSGGPPEHPKLSDYFNGSLMSEFTSLHLLAREFVSELEDACAEAGVDRDMNVPAHMLKRSEEVK